MNEPVYSFKVLFHRLSLSEVFLKARKEAEFKFSFAAKLMRFPTSTIPMERAVKRSELGGGLKPRFIEVGCGKAVTVRESPERMIDFIEESNLLINVLETSKGIEEIAFVSLALRSFKKYIITEQSEDHYRRATFKLFDTNDKEIGQLELSMSFIRVRREFGDSHLASIPGQEFPGSFLTANKFLESTQKQGKTQEEKKLPFSGNNSRASGFYDASSKQLDNFRNSEKNLKEPTGNRNRVDKPSVYPHMTPSMLSGNDFGFPPQPLQRSAIEAMEARKQSQLALDESKQSIGFQPQNNYLQKPNIPQDLTFSPNYQNQPRENQTYRSDKNTVSLEKKLEELSKMPTIHEMANGCYCPLPLFYEKVNSIYQKKIVKQVDNQQRPSTSHTGLNTQGNKGNMFSDRVTPNSKGQSKIKNGEAGDSLKRPSTAGQVNNTIVLNEKATKQLLQDTNFQLQINQGMLFDLLLKELLALKSQQTGSAPREPEPLRVIVENPQMFINQPYPHSQKEDDKGTNGVTRDQKKASTHYLANESLKDSVFQQSINSRKPPPDKRKDLESINEDMESKGSKGFDEDFTSLKDEHMFSLSASHPAKEPSKLGQSGMKQYNNKFSNQPPPRKNTDYKPPEEDSYGADFESQLGISGKDNFSQSQPKNTELNKLENKLPEEEKRGIPCINCKQLIPVDGIAKHLALCMHPEKKDKLMMASVSHDIYKESFAEDLGNSVSRSSAIKRPAKEPPHKQEGRLKTEYEDEFDQFDNLPGGNGISFEF